MQFLDSRFMAVVTGIQLGILGSQKLSFCTSASFFFLLVTINFWILVFIQLEFSNIPYEFLDSHFSVDNFQ